MECTEECPEWDEHFCCCPLYDEGNCSKEKENVILIQNMVYNSFGMYSDDDSEKYYGEFTDVETAEAYAEENNLNLLL